MTVVEFDKEAVVLLSGGQDSTTCLAWAIEHFEGPVHTVAFDYNQKHKIELERASYIASLFQGKVADHKVIRVEALFDLASAALTNPGIDVEAEASKESQNVHAAKHGLPSTFVPGRNMLFLTLACAYGATIGVYDLVTGVCQQDESGYPDCRGTFIAAAEAALFYALDDDVRIHAPLLRVSKRDTWAMAVELGILDIVINETHTCYNGDHEHLHSWGYGCDACPACKERKRGYEEAFGIVEMRLQP